MTTLRLLFWGLRVLTTINRLARCPSQSTTPTPKPFDSINTFFCFVWAIFILYDILQHLLSPSLKNSLISVRALEHSSRFSNLFPSSWLRIFINSQVSDTAATTDRRVSSHSRDFVEITEREWETWLDGKDANDQHVFENVVHIILPSDDFARVCVVKCGQALWARKNTKKSFYDHRFYKKKWCDVKCWNNAQAST